MTGAAPAQLVLQLDSVVLVLLLCSTWGSEPAACAALLRSQRRTRAAVSSCSPRWWTFELIVRTRGSQRDCHKMLGEYDLITGTNRI